jgi:hypothetical protein
MCSADIEHNLAPLSLSRHSVDPIVDESERAQLERP